MTQAKTFIRKTAWISIFPQLTVMGTLMFVFSNRCHSWVSYLPGIIYGIGARYRT